MKYLIVYQKSNTGWGAYAPDLPGLGPGPEAVEGRRPGRSGSRRRPPERYLPGRVHGKVRACDLRAACVPEEVAEGQKDSPERCGPDFAAAPSRQRGLRGAIWQTVEIADP